MAYLQHNCCRFSVPQPVAAAPQSPAVNLESGCHPCRCTRAAFHDGGANTLDEVGATVGTKKGQVVTAPKGGGGLDASLLLTDEQLRTENAYDRCAHVQRVAGVCSIREPGASAGGMAACCLGQPAPPFRSAHASCAAGRGLRRRQMHSIRHTAVSC